MLEGKHIVLGITGSIAAYKACLIIRSLVKKGAEVQVVITPSGKEFVTPTTLSALTHKPVVSEFFDRRDGSWHSHVDLGLWADAMLIAPCTASTLGKMASGVADNMLITTYLSMKAPVFVAPAMDLDMYAHPVTQRNIKTLADLGVEFIEPATGFLASGLEGKGRMEEPEAIVERLSQYLSKKDTYVNRCGDVAPLQGKRVMITAGPTHEKIDPVRFIGNYSSGKMGFALADECAQRGAEVTLVAGPVSLDVHNPSIRRVDVESAQQMYDAAMASFPGQDAAILCAAVADYRPEHVAENKIKREKPLASAAEQGGAEQAGRPDGLLLRLVPNPDIAAALGRMKRENQRLIGFALETDNEATNAKEKLKRKNLDSIILNSLRNDGTCFQSDQNQVSIFTSDGQVKSYPKKDKAAVAADIIDHLQALLLS